MKAEISQSMLKHSSNEEKERFAFEVLSFINPKYTEESDFEMDKMKLIKFASGCCLTKDEFLFALELSSKKQLIYNDRPVEYFREIDFSQLGAIETAYIEHKRKDKQYEKGKEQLKTIMEKTEPTPEELKAHRNELKRNISECFDKHGECEFAFLIYDELKEAGKLDKYRKPEIYKPIQDEKMAKFLSREFMRNLFYNPAELRDLKSKFQNGEKFKIPDLVVQEVKNEIIKKYYNERKNIE